jgi:hypothetical protein
MPDDSATEKASSTENRDNTIVPGWHGSNDLTSPIGRAIQAIEHPIDLAVNANRARLTSGISLGLDFRATKINRNYLLLTKGTEREQLPFLSSV